MRWREKRDRKWDREEEGKRAFEATKKTLSLYPSSNGYHLTNLGREERDTVWRERRMSHRRSDRKLKVERDAKKRT